MAGLRQVVTTVLEKLSNMPFQIRPDIILLRSAGFAGSGPLETI
jgi:hypothetical protein